MGYGLDEKGLKMSKSKGNALDPLPIIEKFGADTFRFWSASEVNHGSDFRCSEQKIESTKKFLTKLWNVSRFLSSFPIVETVETTEMTDHWIIAELDKLVKDCKVGFDEYNFFIPATAIREWTWNVFAAQYIEMVKARAYGIGFSDTERDSAIYTLHKVLSTLLKLLAPITPFITDFLWRTLYSDKSIHTEQLEQLYKVDSGLDYDDPEKPVEETLGDFLGEYYMLISEFNAEVWNAKKEKGLHLPDSIKIEVPEWLEIFKKDLVAMHHLEI
jgi:valyl-tRNA synthetase